MSTFRNLMLELKIEKMLALPQVPYIVEKFGTSNYSTLIKQNYGKVEMNNKVLQSPAPWKKKALHFWGASKS